jgi:A/G-specific adenine glycosylase
MAKWSELASRVVDWHGDSARSFPWRGDSATPWDVLLAELLLRQTDAKRVVPVFESLRLRAPTPASLAAIPVTELEALLRPLGLYRQRAVGISALASCICNDWRGELPTSVQDLLRLPHVGPYAAGAVVVFARGGRAVLPDVNIGRIGGRYLGLAHGSRSEIRRVASRIGRLAPKGHERDFYLALLDLSAAICRAKPMCLQCPLNRTCRSASLVLKRRKPIRTPTSSAGPRTASLRRAQATSDGAKTVSADARRTRASDRPRFSATGGGNAFPTWR